MSWKRSRRSYVLQFLQRPLDCWARSYRQGHHRANPQIFSSLARLRSQAFLFEDGFQLPNASEGLRGNHLVTMQIKGIRDASVGPVNIRSASDQAKLFA
jgi:hypothetical protein